MGHSINYITCAENADRRSIMADIQAHARRAGDGYSSKMTWHDLPPFKSREEAEQFIRLKDNGWYDDHAVRFIDYSKANKTAKIAEYEAKIAELSKAEREYREAHSIHTFQAKHIGCAKCGSKLAKEYIVGEKCPLCRADLRSKTTLDKLQWYQDKKNEYNKRIEAEKAKQKKNSRVMWLVKYEFHC